MRSLFRSPEFLARHTHSHKQASLVTHHSISEASTRWSFPQAQNFCESIRVSAASPLIAEDKFFGVGTDYHVDSFTADWENLAPLTPFEASLFPMNPMSDDWPWLNNGDAPDSEIVSSTTCADESASGTLFDQLLSEGAEASNLDVPMEPIFTEAVVDPVDDFAPTDDEETVVVIHYHDEDSEEEAPKPQSPVPQPPARRLKTRRGRKKPQANAWSMQRRTSGSGESKKAAASAPVSVEAANLKKLYEHTPFKNAELERCRRNAVNAKINRERKKAQMDEMVAEMKKLREENERLRRQMQTQAQQNNQAQSELRQMADLIRTGGGDFTAVLKLAASLDSEE